MALEKIELIDGTEAEIQCTFLKPRKAYALVRQLMKVTEMTPITLETVDKDGKKVFEKTNKMVGDFSGIIELIPLSVDEIVADCPQKNNLSVKSMKRLYEKYVEQTIQEVMTSVSPKL